MKMPLTVKPQKYYDADSGKPIGEEYWVLDADGQEVCCMDEEEEARRIVAAVNACEGIDTETLEELVVQFGEKLRAENARLRAENARLLEALNALVAVAKPIFERYDENFEEHEMQPGSVSPDSLFIAINAARAAISEYTTTTI